MASTLEMIDLHCHILPGLDDGPKEMEESIRMGQLAYEDGIRTIVATPHSLNSVYQNGKSMILTRVEELCSELRTQHSELSLKILPGADVHLSERILQEVEKGEVVTVGDGGKFILIEFPYQSIPAQAEKILFHLLGRGLIPIISHPERNLEIMRKPGRYYEMIRMGCLGQVTAMSLTGDFGPQIRDGSERLMKSHLVHLIATDAHSVDRRPPLLSPAVKAAEKMIGRKEAEKMVTEYPQAILEGKKPDLPDPVSPEPVRRRRW